MNNIKKLKHCKYGDHDLPISEFSSTQARHCNSCKKIRAFEMAKERRLKQVEKLQNKLNNTMKSKKTPKLSTLKRSTQTTYNKFIRNRDEELPCISCTKQLQHAGHFIPVGVSSLLRYHPDNTHGQCGTCNTHKHGNLIEYRINLVNKIGLEKVEWLEQHRNDYHKYTREQLKSIVDCCKAGVYTEKEWKLIMEIK